MYVQLGQVMSDLFFPDFSCGYIVVGCKDMEGKDSIGAERGEGTDEYVV